MENEPFESNEMLEKIEADALESMEEISPLENTEEPIEAPENVNEPSIEMCTCTCMGGCGSNYSHSTECTCMGNCGSNYHKG